MNDEPRRLEYPVIPDMIPLPPIMGGTDNTHGGGQQLTEAEVVAMILYRQQTPARRRRLPR